LAPQGSLKLYELGGGEKAEEPGYSGPSSFRLFKRGGFKVGRVDLSGKF